MTRHASVAEARLRELVDTFRDDPELGHVEADNALVTLLRVLGYAEVCNLYEALQPKWYA